jgi:hypothetical protein
LVIKPQKWADSLNVLHLKDSLHFNFIGIIH